MNSRRPFKPNQPNVPKSFKLFDLMRLRQTFVFSSLPYPVISPLYQPISIDPFLTASQAPNNFLTNMSMVG